MNSLKGQILIAAPELTDPNFVRTAILMVQHDEDGAVGVVLNRPTQLTVRAAWEQVSSAHCGAEGVIYQGGPMNGPLMVIHTLADASQLEVCDGVFFTTEFDSVEHLVDQGAQPAKFVVGYAGWGPQQLEDEMATEAWLTSPATSDIIFTANQDIWETLMVMHRWAAMGVQSLRSKMIPDDPSLN